MRASRVSIRCIMNVPIVRTTCFGRKSIITLRRDRLLWWLVMQGWRSFSWGIIPLAMKTSKYCSMKPKKSSRTAV